LTGRPMRILTDWQLSIVLEFYEHYCFKLFFNFSGLF